MLRFAFVTPVAIALPLPAERATPPLNASVAGEKISPVAGKGEPRNAPLDFQRALKREMEALGSQAQRAPSGQVQPLMILGAPEEELALPHRAPLFALLETGGDLVEEAGASRPPEAGEPFSDSIPQGMEPTLWSGGSSEFLCLPVSVASTYQYAGEDATNAAVDVSEVPQRVMGQVMQTIRGQEVITHLDFQITPPALGPVNLQVSYTQGVVGVQLTALNLTAKQALEAQLNSIQATLIAHNLTPGSLKVVLSAPGRSGANGAGGRHEGASPRFAHASPRRRSGEAPEDSLRSL